MIDTSVQTAKTGEMHRRMVGGYCNVVLANDSSLRMGKDSLLSPTFNLGFAIENNVSVDVCGSRVTSPFDLQQMALELNSEKGWVKDSVHDTLREAAGRRSRDTAAAGGSTSSRAPRDRLDGQGGRVLHLRGWPRCHLARGRQESAGSDRDSFREGKDAGPQGQTDPVWGRSSV